jgi:hypothetical protein
MLLPSALVYFSDRVSKLFAQAGLDVDLPIYASCVNPVCLLMYSLTNFLPGLALNFHSFAQVAEKLQS